MPGRPNLLKAPHHAHITSANGHWVIGGCDNASKAPGLDRRVVSTVKDPFGGDAQLYVVNKSATLHPCIRMSYDFAGVEYVGRIEAALTWSAHFKMANAGHVRLVIFNREQRIPHSATFRFAADGDLELSSTLNAEGLTAFHDRLPEGWHRLGIGLLGGSEVGDIKNVFLYPSAPRDPLVIGHGSYIAGAKLEKGIGMTEYEPAEWSEDPGSTPAFEANA